MSMYGDSEKDNFYYEIKEFLKGHKVSELLDMVTTAVERKEDAEEDDYICPNCGYDRRAENETENNSEIKTNA